MPLDDRFAFCELSGMTKLRTFRKKNGWTLSQASEQLGLSKSYLNELETGARPWTLKAARQVEAKTGGKLKATELLGLTGRRSGEPVSA